jgi:hypothetical protein
MLLLMQLTLSHGQLFKVKMTYPNYKSTHVLEAYNMLIEQFKNKPILNALLAIYIEKFQEIEDVFSDIYDAQLLASSTGSALYEIGNIEGITMTSLSDAAYRAIIEQVQFTNNSSGDLNTILEFISLFGAYSYLNVLSGGAKLRIDTNIVLSITVSAFFKFLQNTLAAGVGLQLSLGGSSVFMYRSVGGTPPAFAGTFGVGKYASYLTA